MAGPLLLPTRLQNCYLQASSRLENELQEAPEVMMGFWSLVSTEPSDVLRPLLATFVTQNSVAPGDNFTSAKKRGTLQQFLSMRLEFYLFNQKVKIGSFKKLYLI